MNRETRINNQFYEELGERWYEDDRHPIALLRAETKTRLAYVEQVLLAKRVSRGRILDLGCGGGFVTIPLAQQGYDVRGIDISANALAVARKRMPAGRTISFIQDDIYHLHEEAGTYDVVLMMDILEHLEEQEVAIGHASRVLKPGGLLIFHTFNRNLLAYLVAVKGIKALCADSPANIHVYHLFIKPAELRRMCARAELTIRELVGIRPNFMNRAFFRSLFRRRVDPGFAFRLTRSVLIGYLGYAEKKGMPMEKER